MTRKDYELIAQAINDAREIVARESGNKADVVAGANAGFYELARVLSLRFSEQNARFDANKWMTAANVLWN
jgi:hypothetical protein